MKAAPRPWTALLRSLAAIVKCLGTDEWAMLLLPAMHVMDEPIAEVSPGGVSSIVAFMIIVAVAISPDCITADMDSTNRCILDLETAGRLADTARRARS